mmetsp:Transcript_26242/g.38896  ORF Transcript_26242/g.38896 Transcript_26242/m.38896 type:complete len:125 (+) Transcript_26242:732-1106(+)
MRKSSWECSAHGVMRSRKRGAQSTAFSSKIAAAYFHEKSWITPARGNAVLRAEEVEACNVTILLATLTCQSARMEERSEYAMEEDEAAEGEPCVRLYNGRVSGLPQHWHRTMCFRPNRGTGACV